MMHSSSTIVLMVRRSIRIRIQPYNRAVERRTQLFENPRPAGWGGYQRLMVIEFGRLQA